MSSHIQIAQAVSDADLTAVATLFRAYEASLDVDLGYQGFADELASLPGQYARPRGALLLARGDEGAALGCAALRPTTDPARCEMKRLYVPDAGRGLGIGRQLMHAAIDSARTIGYRELLLDTLPSMAAAQGLYRAAGFEPVAPYYDTPVTGTVFLRLTLDRA